MAKGKRGRRKLQEYQRKLDELARIAKEGEPFTEAKLKQTLARMARSIASVKIQNQLIHSDDLCPEVIALIEDEIDRASSALAEYRTAMHCLLYLIPPEEVINAEHDITEEHGHQCAQEADGCQRTSGAND